MTITTQTKSSVPAELSKFATRGSRSTEAAENIRADLEALKDRLQEITEQIGEFEGHCDDYVDNDPAEASGTDAREQAREAREDAWYEMQALAEAIADTVDNLITEDLRMEPLR